MTRALLLLALLAACGDPPAANDASDGSGSASTSTSDPGPGSTSTSDPGSTGAPTTGAGEPGECWTDLAPFAQEPLYAGFADGSEGASFGADGRLRVTSGDHVWTVDAAGVAGMFAEVPAAVGLADLADGGFVVAAFGVAQAPDGAVYRVGADGQASVLAVGIDDPNFVTIAPDGSALVSDDFDTRVFRVTLAGEVSVVLEVESPNGMAYGPDGASFYVASTFTADGQLTRFDVDDAGLPVQASAREILHLGTGSTPDGIAVDEDGYVYVAANLGNAIWRVDGAAETLQPGELVAELAYPASLAFGRGAGYDPCSIYVTQLLADGVIRVAIGARGAPLYH
jgi:gluconolactonase